MHNPVATKLQALQHTAIELFVIWMPITISNVFINGIYSVKPFGNFNINLHNNGVKVHSTAIGKFRAEMQQIKKTIAAELAHKKSNFKINNRQKGRDNHTNSQKVTMVTLPAAQSINHLSLLVGGGKKERRLGCKYKY
jgi:hypothetical protein